MEVWSRGHNKRRYSIQRDVWRSENTQKELKKNTAVACRFKRIDLAF